MTGGGDGLESPEERPAGSQPSLSFLIESERGQRAFRQLLDWTQSRAHFQARLDEGQDGAAELSGEDKGLEIGRGRAWEGRQGIATLLES